MSTGPVMDATNFFSDSVADIEGAGAYRNYFDVEDGGYMAQRQALFYDNAGGLATAAPISLPLSALYLPPDGIWTLQPQTLQPPPQLGFGQPPQQYDPALEVGGKAEVQPAPYPQLTLGTPEAEPVPQAESHSTPIKVERRSSESAGSARAASPGKAPAAKKRKTGNGSAAKGTAPKKPRQPPREPEKDPELDPEQEEKRKQALEKNRIAALKCRQRKKEYVNDLERKRATLEKTNMALCAEFHRMSCEMNALREALMKHISCGDPNINKWLDTEAKTASQKKLPSLAPLQVSPSLCHVRRHSADSAVPMYPSSAVGETPTPSSGTRRDSLVLSNASSSLQASPIEGSFTQLTSPVPKREPDTDFDFDRLMTDGLACGVLSGD